MESQVKQLDYLDFLDGVSKAIITPEEYDDIDAYINHYSEHRYVIFPGQYYTISLKYQDDKMTDKQKRGMASLAKMAKELGWKDENAVCFYFYW